MTDNLSRGPLMVSSNDPTEINIVLQEIQTRIDEMNGLRGRTLIYDRARVDNPTQSQDALTLGTVSSTESLFRVTYIAPPGGYVAAPASISYVELSSALRQVIDFSKQSISYARLLVTGWATEAGTHTLAITDATGAVIADLAWTGQTEDTFEGAWEPVTVLVATETQLRAKGATTTDTFVLASVVMECRGKITVT